MNLPNLLTYATEEEYRQHYIKHYCKASPIMTFDAIPVMFYTERFDHAFFRRTYKSWKAKKDVFAIERAKRLDWIKYVLQDSNIIPRKGYDKVRNSYDNSRRVVFMNEENYLVVIYINKSGQANFITAYIVDNEETAEKIRNSPKWESYK